MVKGFRVWALIAPKLKPFSSFSHGLSKPSTYTISDITPGLFRSVIHEQLVSQDQQSAAIQPVASQLPKFYSKDSFTF